MSGKAMKGTQSGRAHVQTKSTTNDSVDDDSHPGSGLRKYIYIIPPKEANNGNEVCLVECMPC
jgi:hypothetical protein